MIETREYPVPLTDEELKSAAEFVGLIHKRIQDRESAFAEVRQEYKAAIKELRSGLAMQLEKLSTRREVREVELEIVFNSPEKGMKQIYLASTGALIDTVEMTEDDEQDLFASTEEKEPEEEHPKEEVCDICHTNPVHQIRENGTKVCFGCMLELNIPGEDDPEDKDPDLDRRRMGKPADPARKLGDCLSENGQQNEVCSKCHECHYVLHINNGKPVCGICRAELNIKKISEIDKLMTYWKGMGDPPRALFRAQFGYGCVDRKQDTTCFRFMLKSGSWGNHVYMAGDYTLEGSQAYAFYNSLLTQGWKED